MQSYNILEAISDAASMDLFTSVANRESIHSDSLMSSCGLTEKQYYTRVQRLAQNGLIRRKSSVLSLTSFGKIVCDFKLRIDNAIAEYYSLKAIDAFRESKELDHVQRKELIEKIITNGGLKLILSE
jgi:hypothetical protein